MGLAQPTPELGRKLVVALLAHRLQIQLVELCLLIHLLVADRAGEMMHAPSLVQRGENITTNYLVADKAQISKQLMIMSFTVGQALLLIMAMSQERFLAFSANKVLYMPMFAESSDNTFLNRSTASSTNGNAHLVMTTQAIEFIHFVGSQAFTTLDFPGVRRQFHLTGGAVKVIWVIHLTSEPQRFVVNNSMALVADVLASSSGPGQSATVVAERLSLMTNEAEVGQLLAALLATEALGVPVGVHRLNHSPNHEFAAFSTARCKENMKVMFAVFPALKFIEGSIRKRPKALGTHKTLRMPKFSVGIDNLLMRLKAISTSGAEHFVKRCYHTRHLRKEFRLSKWRKSIENDGTCTSDCI